MTIILDSPILISVLNFCFFPVEAFFFLYFKIQSPQVHCVQKIQVLATAF